MRVFLDANILFSAAKSDGAVRLLLALLEKAGHQCHADAFVVEEARRNLAAKAGEALETLGAILLRIRVAAVQPADPDLAARRPLPEKDRPVLAAAIRQRCEVLVTGDQTHFGPFFGRTLEGVTIYSPRMLAEKLLT